MTDEHAKRPAFEPAARLLSPTGYDPGMPRPTATIVGFVLVLLRVLAGVMVLIAVWAGWDSLTTAGDLTLEGVGSTVDVTALTAGVVVTTGAFVLLADALLAIFLFRGRNWARVVLMMVAVLSISTSFVAWWVQGQEITLEGTFVSLCLDILLLLALSSRSAAAYARRREKP